MMIGKKSSEHIQAGYVWAPYVPAYSTVDISGFVRNHRFRMMCEIWDFEPPVEMLGNQLTTKSVKSRYSVTQVNGAYYGTIDINKKTD